MPKDADSGLELLSNESLRNHMLGDYAAFFELVMAEREVQRAFVASSDERLLKVSHKLLQAIEEMGRIIRERRKQCPH